MGVRGGSDRQREGWRKEGNERKGGEIDRERKGRWGAAMERGSERERRWRDEVREREEQEVERDKERKGGERDRER